MPRDRPTFDLQAHRGGIGLTVENTLASFDKAIRLGVSTLELDTQITQDGQSVVTHDRKVSGAKCADTGPATPGDPEYPYVGKYVNTLTLPQVRTLDCGSLTQPGLPRPAGPPGCADAAAARGVRAGAGATTRTACKLNVETKVEAGAPPETAPREQFVQVGRGGDPEAPDRPPGDDPELRLGLADADAPGRPAAAAGRAGPTTTSCRPASRASPRGSAASTSTTSAATRSRRSTSFGADAISPVHGFPQNGKVTDPAYRPYVTAGRWCDRAHKAGDEGHPVDGRRPGHHAAS